MKIKLIKTLSYRALMMWSEWKVDIELKKFSDIFLANGYPKGFILSNLKFSISSVLDTYSYLIVVYEKDGR